jgi:hypothetical protein
MLLIIDNVKDKLNYLFWEVIKWGLETFPAPLNSFVSSQPTATTP